MACCAALISSVILLPTLPVCVSSEWNCIPDDSTDDYCTLGVHVKSLNVTAVFMSEGVFSMSPVNPEAKRLQLSCVTGWTPL